MYSVVVSINMGNLELASLQQYLILVLNTQLIPKNKNLNLDWLNSNKSLLIQKLKFSQSRYRVSNLSPMFQLEKVILSQFRTIKWKRDLCKFIHGVVDGMVKLVMDIGEILFVQKLLKLHLIQNSLWHLVGQNILLHLTLRGTYGIVDQNLLLGFKILIFLKLLILKRLSYQKT